MKNSLLKVSVAVFMWTISSNLPAQSLSALYQPRPLAERAKAVMQDNEFNQIEISRVLAFSQPGDQLVIDPVQAEYWKARRVLKIVE